MSVDKAALVGDLSLEARKLAEADGWSGNDHARMHPKTAAEYERRAESSAPFVGAR